MVRIRAEMSNLQEHSGHFVYFLKCIGVAVAVVSDMSGDAWDQIVLDVDVPMTNILLTEFACNVPPTGAGCQIPIGIWLIFAVSALSAQWV
eukprot:scaffold171164_cov12-Prasinocladus_malaysianus.AAC.1